MSKKKLFWVLVLVAGSAGPLSYLGYLPIPGLSGDSVEAAAASHDGHGPAPTKGESFYLPIDPPFIVNFTHLGALRYLQISLEIMYPDRASLDLVDMHMPAIRNALILLLSDQPYEKLSTLEGKQKLRGEMVAAVNEIIFPETVNGNPGEIFITNFVMQ